MVDGISPAKEGGQANPPPETINTQPSSFRARLTAGGINALPNKLRKGTGRPDIDERIKELVADFGCENSCELVEQLVMTALKMARDKISVADLKLFNRSLKESNSGHHAGYSSPSATARRC